MENCCTAKSLMNSFINLMKEERAPWQKEVNTTKKEIQPYNPATGKIYKGYNELYLKVQQEVIKSTDSRWLNENQCNMRNLKIHANEKARESFATYYVKQNENKKGYYDYEVLYNGSQIIGLPESESNKFNYQRSLLSPFPSYKAADSTPKEILIQEISLYLSALNNHSIFIPSQTFNKTEIINYLIQISPTELVRIINTGYLATVIKIKKSSNLTKV